VSKEKEKASFTIVWVRGRRAVANWLRERLIIDWRPGRV
jgi:hypothetical protein